MCVCTSIYLALYTNPPSIPQTHANDLGLSAFSYGTSPKFTINLTIPIIALNERVCDDKSKL